MSPDWLIRSVDTVTTTAVAKATAARSSLTVAPMVEQWLDAALTNTLADHGDRLGSVERCDAVAEIQEWAKANGLQQVVMARPTVGPTADHLAGLEDRLSADGIRLVFAIRPCDSAAWPRATHGFFKFREAIPKLLAAL
jgi:deoxyribodipyrimidine photo-lyase